jgi:hypothetical protein
MKAEAGRTTERPSGTRAATMLTKLPSASAGQKGEQAESVVHDGLIGRRGRAA